MEIDFKKPDSPLQIEGLQKLLQLENPTEEEIVIAMFLILVIFYENRPGNLSGKTDYSIYGGGCHNPASEKNNKTLWGVMRYEINIGHKNDLRLRISNEHVIGGFLKATFLSSTLEWTITADIFFDKKNIFQKRRDIIRPNSVTIIGKNQESIMKELKNWLAEPLATLAAVEVENES